MIALTKAGKPRKRVPAGAPVVDRIALHVQVDDSGCWIWQGTKTNGYGRIYLEKSLRFAHRVSYEAHVGPIPTGMQIDHLCRKPACVNPEHLEPVTPQENTLRGRSYGANAIRSGTCRRGHSRDVWGVVAGPRTYCRLCRVAYLRAYNAAKKRGEHPSVDLDAIFNSKRLLALYNLVDMQPEDILDNTAGAALAAHRYGPKPEAQAAA